MHSLHLRLAGSFKKICREIIAVLSSHTVKGSVLVLIIALVAFGTGALVLFVDMPLIPMGVLSVISVIALIFFVAAVRARFFPPPLPDVEVDPVTRAPPDQGLNAEPGTSRARRTCRDLPSHLLAVPMSMGNRTDRGDALILAACIIAILAGYATFFIDLPVILLVILGIISIAGIALAVFASLFRFVPAKMAKFLSAPVSEAQHSGSAPGLTHTGTEIATGEPAPAKLPEKPVGGIRDVYWVQSPYAYIKIVRQGNLGFVYTVVEPVITTREKIVLQETYNYLRDVIIYDNPEKSSADQLKRETIYRTLQEYDPTIKNERLPILYYFLQRDLSGFGLLEPLMHDPALEDISCNGENLPVFVFHRIYGSLPTSVLFHEGELNQYVLKLAQKANKQISLSNPMVDATLPDGSRLQVTYSNVISTKGSSFTIRRFRADPMTPIDLMKLGTYNAEILAFLWLVIEHRRSLIIAGGTASGKTSTMNAVSLFIPLNSKIVSLEDTREIQLPHRNWLPTQTRELNAEGLKGDIDLFSLLKACMRQRPDYIIVG